MASTAEKTNTSSNCVLPGSRDSLNDKKPSGKSTAKSDRRPSRPKLAALEDQDVRILKLEDIMDNSGPSLVMPTLDRDMASYIDYLSHVFLFSRRMVAVTGAGISVSAGIPDFRSESGLFAILRKNYNLKTSGKQLFDSSVYHNNESTMKFHLMLRELHNQCLSATHTDFHHYLSDMAVNGQLLRLYTQNIDCLDITLPGLSTTVPLNPKPPFPKTVQLHGTLDKMSCTKCGLIKKLDPRILSSGDTAECAECMELESVRETAGVRARGVGRLRPRIVLYNEFNPDGEAIGNLTTADLRAKPDALIVAGTSLKVPGVARIVKEMARTIHHTRTSNNNNNNGKKTTNNGAVVWINYELPPKEFIGCFDLIVLGDCQKVPILAREWTEVKQDFKKLIKKRSRTPSTSSPSTTDSSVEVSTVIETAAVRGNARITDTFRVSSNKRVKKDISKSIKQEDGKT